MSSKIEKPLRIGFVPEHFSAPLVFAKKHFNLDCSLIPFPSGTGHMVTSLQAGELDMAVGLTEGWISAICKAEVARKNPGFKLVGTYVRSPLRWAISTGAGRDDIKGIADLKGGVVGVSRMGSGSYVMSYMLAMQQGWVKPMAGEHSPFQVEELNTFGRLREGVNDKTADFFMWEYFTTKRYYDNGELKHIGDVYTPWPSWMIVASSQLAQPVGSTGHETVLDTLQKVDEGIKYFQKNQEEAVEYISTKMDYSEADAREWLKTVEFQQHVNSLNAEEVRDVIKFLVSAGAIPEKSLDGDLFHNRAKFGNHS
ncbi:periplasmic binding protein-like II [Westerdykella ornata]|uniref:Periplasmic binding protein-like II n=1 Tax=Westerdykella ornata TaxID=318751 RepID=A0A6A6JU24_WESOR|nr:periplasmic binding protein-like II [Westerdykella ornata]KAF2279877.1 periplasmic binding protein-like II [Westerdykella ornata]